MSEELKPCPLCCRKAKLEIDREQETTHITCTAFFECGCSLYLNCVDKELATKRWNTRAKEPTK